MLNEYSNAIKKYFIILGLCCLLLLLSAVLLIVLDNDVNNKSENRVTDGRFKREMRHFSGEKPMSFLARFKESDKCKELKENIKSNAIIRRKRTIQNSEDSGPDVDSHDHSNAGDMATAGGAEYERKKRRAEMDYFYLNEQYTRCKKDAPDKSNCDSIQKKLLKIAKKLKEQYSELDDVIHTIASKGGTKKDSSEESNEKKNFSPADNTNYLDPDADLIPKVMPNSQHESSFSENTSEKNEDVEHLITTVVPIQNKADSAQKENKTVNGQLNLNKNSTDSSTDKLIENKPTKTLLVNTETTTISIMQPDHKTNKDEFNSAPEKLNVLETTTIPFEAKIDVPEMMKDEKSNFIDEFRTNAQSHVYVAVPKVHEDLANETDSKMWHGAVNRQTVTNVVRTKNKNAMINSNPLNSNFNKLRDSNNNENKRDGLEKNPALGTVIKNIYIRFQYYVTCSLFLFLDPTGQILHLCDQITRQNNPNEQIINNLPPPTSTGFVTNNGPVFPHHYPGN